MSDPVKFYKNPQRKEHKAEKYVPEYKKLGMEPIDYKSAHVPMGTPISPPQPASNRNRTVELRTVLPNTSNLDNTKHIIPNVGNNIEHTWASMDGIEDDLSGLDVNHPMIDNNDFITVESEDLSINNDKSSSTDIDLVSILNDLQEDNVLLLVKNEPICCGPTKEIEDQVNALIFGEHELCGGTPVSPDDILVLKKLKVKVGVFLG